MAALVLSQLACGVFQTSLQKQGGWKFRQLGIVLPDELEFQTSLQKQGGWKPQNGPALWLKWWFQTSLQKQGGWKSAEKTACLLFLAHYSTSQHLLVPALRTSPAKLKFSIFPRNLFVVCRPHSLWNLVERAPAQFTAVFEPGLLFCEGK